MPFKALAWIQREIIATNQANALQLYSISLSETSQRYKHAL